MEQDIITRLTTLEGKIDEVFRSVEKTRKYFLWTLIISVALFILPLIGLVFAIPTFLSNYVTEMSGTGL